MQRNKAPFRLILQYFVRFAYETVFSNDECGVIKMLGMVSGNGKQTDR